MILDKVFRDYKTQEGFVRICVFLFIAGAYNVKHVASLIFMALFFLSIFVLTRLKENRAKLSVIEKYVFIFLLVYFLWFVITSIIPGWGNNQTERLGLELRFVIAIPVYMLLRQVKDLLLPVWYGVTVSLWLGFIITIYQVYVLNIGAAGAYDKLLIGPMSVLYVFMFLSRKGWANTFNLKVFNITTIIIGFVPAMLSGARTAYVVLPILALIWVAINYNWRRQLLIISGLVCVMWSVYLISDTVNMGVTRAVNGMLSYYSSNQETSKNKLGSTKTRLEMIKAGYLITKDNPIFGIGDGNLKEVSKKYIKNGLYHSEIGEYRHLHNMYADNSAKKGIPGLILTIMMFFIPVWYFWRLKDQFYFPATMGGYFVAGEAIAGLTLVAPIDRGNFVAVSLIVLSICLSEIMRTKNRKVLE